MSFEKPLKITIILREKNTHNKPKHTTLCYCVSQ